MQFRYVFSELAQGLRRNLSMHIAVVLTLFLLPGRRRAAVATT